MLEDISVLAMNNDTNMVDSDEFSQPPSRTMAGDKDKDKARTKKWAPKTFNGCMTCKKRRIKCDETKPTCQRCQRSNIKCAGYAPPRIKLFDPSAAFSSSNATPSAGSLVLSRSNSTPESQLGPSPTPSEPESEQRLSPEVQSRPQPQHLIVSSTFGDEEERRAFQFYLEKTAKLLSVYSQPYLWTVHLPQAVWQHASLKHSIIALACLHQSLITEGEASQTASHTFIAHYNTAIRALVADRPPIDVVLISSLIFWALENFNGGAQAAFDHMRAALRILGEWKTKGGQNPVTDHLIAQYIEPAIRDGVKFAAEEYAEELADQVTALSLTSIDMKVINLNCPNFPDLSDAHVYLCSCIKETLDLSSSSRLPAYEGTQFGLYEEIGMLEARLERWLHSFQSLTATGPVHSRRMLIIHHVAAKLLIKQLGTNNQHRGSTSSQQEQGIYLNLGIESEMPLQPEVCNSSLIVSEMSDLVSQRNSSTLDPTLEVQTTLDLIPPLFLAATSAITIDTRRSAIDVLRTLDVQEGPWHSEHAARVAEAMLDIADDCNLAPSIVHLRDTDFDIDPNLETLGITWNSTIMTGMVIERSIDASGMNVNIANISGFIRNYGYQILEPTLAT